MCLTIWDQMFLFLQGPRDEEATEIANQLLLSLLWQARWNYTPLYYDRYYCHSLVLVAVMIGDEYITLRKLLVDVANPFQTVYGSRMSLRCGVIAISCLLWRISGSIGEQTN